MERDAWFEQEKQKYADEKLKQYKAENVFDADEHNKRVEALREQD